MKPIRIKICGITRVEDATAAQTAGADAIGLNFYEKSKRYIEPSKAVSIAGAVEEMVSVVGVFVNSPNEEVCEIAQQVGLSHIQLHGDEQPSMVGELEAILPDTLTIRAVRIRDEGFEQAQAEIAQWQDAGVDAILLDAAAAGSFGGTGKRLNWKSLNQLTFDVPWLLAGGLNPENVAEAIGVCQPDGVDVASGVESSPGIKGLKMIQDFVSASKTA